MSSGIISVIPDRLIKFGVLKTLPYGHFFLFGGIKFDYLRVAIWFFVVAFVVFHVERHSAFFTFEATLVPCLR